MLKILFKLILQLTKYIPIHLSFMNSIYTIMKKKKIIVNLKYSNMEITWKLYFLSNH